MALQRTGDKPFDNLHHTNEELFLSFACLFGIKADIPIHRKAIFNYVQTHMSSRSESNLQGQLERSSYWNSLGNAFYALNTIGEEKLVLEFSNRERTFNQYPIVLFQCQLGNHKIAVRSYPEKKSYEIFINDSKVSADYAYQFFRQKGIILNDRSVSKPREIFHWVLNQKYSWEILNYDRIISSN